MRKMCTYWKHTLLSNGQCLLGRQWKTAPSFVWWLGFKNSRPLICYLYMLSYCSDELKLMLFCSSNLCLQCLTLVNYYGPLFFLEISSIQPQQFCQKVALCQKVAFFSQQISNNTCNLCHYAVSEVLVKLKDPDTQVRCLGYIFQTHDPVPIS